MSGIYIFDNSQNLYKTVPDKRIIDNYQEQELNGLISGTCKLKYSSDLEDAFFYGVKDEDKFWLFSIKNAIKKENTITFKGVHIMYDELKGKVVRDLRPNNKLVGSVCTSILKDTGWECISHCNVRGSANFYYQSSLSALYKIAQKFGVDFIPVIKFSDGKIVAKQIHIYSKLGEDLGKVFSYKDNLVQVVAETSSDELFTGFIGRGKGETKTDDSGKATGGYGRKIKFDSIDYKDTIDGITVHSPIGSDMIEIKEATKIYGYPDGSPRICTVDFNDIEDKNELAIATFKYAIEHSRPRVQLRAKGHAYERIGIGEIVTVIGPMDIRFKTRIFKLKKDFLSKKILDFEFGDKIVKSMSDRLKENQTDSKVDEINEISFMDSIFTMIESTYYNEDGYQYDLKPGNKYKLPAGLYSFNKPLDKNPDKVIYFGAGKLMIANSKKDDGSWNFRVALNGDSVNADEIRAGILRGGKVRWNLEDGTLIIGNDPTDYSMYWDGATLHLRNVDIDLENNRTIQDLKNKQGMTDKEIEKRKQEIIKANQGLETARADIDQANLDIADSNDKIRQAREQFDRDIGSVSARVDSNKADFDNSFKGLEDTVNQNKSDWEYRNKVVDEKLLDLNSRFTVTDGKIESSINSIKETMEERIKVTKSDLQKYADDKDGLIAAQIDSKDKELRTYITENYSTKTQTDEKISQEVGSLKTLVNDDIGDLTKEITETKSMIEQTDEKISSEVGKIKIETDEKIRLGDEEVRKYISQNYTTITQTDEKIEATVRSFKDDMSKYESRLTQLKDEISLEVSSSKQSGMYKNLIKSGWKWVTGQGVYRYYKFDENGVAQGGSYVIESNGDLRLRSNKEADTWTSYDFILLEAEPGTKEYTLIFEPSEIKNTVQLPQFRLDDKFNNFLCYGTEINKSDKVYKLTLTEDNQNNIPYQLRLSFKDSQAGTDEDRSIVIPQRKLALVKGWHPNLTWDDVYFPNDQGIEEVRSELKVQTDKISASVSDKVKGLESRLDIQSDQISSKVSNYQFGTKVRQSATDIQIAWNNISKYIQFEHGSIGIYDGSVISSKKRAMFDEDGNHFYRDGYYVGKIGTNQWKNYNSKKGLDFDLEYEGAYMTWAAKDSKYDNTYASKRTYARDYFDGFSSDTLNAGCDIDMHGHKLKNVDFEGGGLTGTLRFQQIKSVDSDGTSNRWYDAMMRFENGILVSGDWS